MQRRIIAIALAGILLAACGGGDGGEDAGGTGTQEGENTASSSTITMRDNEFVPSDATVAPGDVELVNDGESPHNLTIEGEDVDVDVDPGARVTEALDLAPGTYTIFCAFHRSQGMEGTLTIS